MSKITRDDITGALGLGFTVEMFKSIAGDETAFKTLVDAVIAEQSAELSDQLTAAVYNASANLVAVKKAEKALVAAELLRRRITVVLGSVVGNRDGFSVTAERNQRKEYLDDAAIWIGRIAQGSTAESPGGDFSCGSLVTSHFEEES